MNNISIGVRAKLVVRYPKTTFNLIADKVAFRKISPFPRLVKIYVTNVCNLNCSMCVNAAYRMKNLKGSNLTLKNIEKIISELSKHKPFIYFSGGEPLLNKEMIQIIKAFSRAGMFTSLTTNGYVLKNFGRKLSESGLDAISLSLDSDSASEHDFGRGTKGTFDRLMSGLEDLNEQRKKTGTPINVKINTVIRMDNYYKLSQIYDFIETLNVDEWNIQHISYLTPTASFASKKYLEKSGIGEDIFGVPIQKNYYFTKTQINILSEQLKILKEKANNYKTKLAIKPKIDDLSAYYQGKIPLRSSSCRIPFDTIALYDNGKITTGCLAYQIGHLKENRSIEDIWNSQKNKEFQKLISDKKIIPPCFRCCGLNYSFIQNS